MARGTITKRIFSSCKPSAQKESYGEQTPRTVKFGKASSPPAAADSPHSYANVHVDGPNEELRKIFDHFDENKDGQISREDISTSFQGLGMPVSPDDLATMIDIVDSNHDGFVDYSEFIRMYYGCLFPVEGNDDEDACLKKAFQVFDKDGDGFISAEELYSVLSSMGVLQGRTLQDCVNMIRKVDADGNGHVDFEEFKQMMASRRFTLTHQESSGGECGHWGQ